MGIVAKRCQTYATTAMISAQLMEQFNLPLKDRTFEKFSNLGLALKCVLHCETSLYVHIEVNFKPGMIPQLEQSSLFNIFFMHGAAKVLVTDRPAPFIENLFQFYLVFV